MGRQDRFIWDVSDIAILDTDPAEKYRRFRKTDEFNPDEPRGADGKWGEGGGGAEGNSFKDWSAANPFGNENVFDAANEYLKSAGKGPLKVLSQQALTPEEGRAVANSYDLASSDPYNENTKAAYKAFNDELAGQRAAAEKAGFKFVPWTQPGQPYANSKEMMKDVKDNKHLYYFKSTEGTTPNTLMSLEQNDTFRAVHDLFGHAMAGNQFGPKGETNAFLDHVQMFSPAAQKALATETLGQNAWFNYSKANEGKSVTERKFADQKAFLLDPSLYKPLLMRAGVHTDSDDDAYHACPCHRNPDGSRTDYDDDEPRGADGKWTSGGSSKEQRSALSKLNPKTSDEFKLKKTGMNHEQLARTQTKDQPSVVKFAHIASAKAKDLNTKEAHLTAANSHDKAAARARHEGEFEEAEKHQAKAEEHRAKAKVAEIQEIATQGALADTKTAMAQATPEAHEAAAGAHENAAQVAMIAGNTEKAELHQKLAEEHTKVAGEQKDQIKAGKAHAKAAEKAAKGEGGKPSARSKESKVAKPDLHALDTIHLMAGQLELIRTAAEKGTADDDDREKKEPGKSEDEGKEAKKAEKPEPKKSTKKG